jgi:hypothetical protein
MNLKNKMTKADEILSFYASLNFTDKLPGGIGIMNPYQDSLSIRSLCAQFYHKYYNDHLTRKLILGINPGRLGAGATGIPFTDTKRLNVDCGIAYDGFTTHEPSSVFVYKVIEAYGGPEKFYADFYINSICPLGFVKIVGNKEINYNYYDSSTLQNAMSAFIKWNLAEQIKISGQNQIAYVLGTGKNFNYLQKFNEKYKLFDEILPLEHPRYVMQYKAKSMNHYIDHYLQAFTR